MEDIFDCQRMQLILGGKGMDHIHIRKSVYVDPADDRPIRAVVRQKAVQVVYILNESPLGTVIDTTHIYRQISAGELPNILMFQARGIPGLAFEKMHHRSHKLLFLSLKKS
jgi:hypothetical protein